jgi:hypothetical protein
VIAQMIRHDCAAESYERDGTLYCPVCREFVEIVCRGAEPGEPLQDDDLERLPAGVTFNGRSGAEFFWETHYDAEYEPFSWR